jgi:hypothetical protein
VNAFEKAKLSRWRSRRCVSIRAELQFLAIFGTAVLLPGPQHCSQELYAEKSGVSNREMSRVYSCNEICATRQFQPKAGKHTHSVQGGPCLFLLLLSCNRQRSDQSIILSGNLSKCTQTFQLCYSQTLDASFSMLCNHPQYCSQLVCLFRHKGYTYQSVGFASHTSTCMKMLQPPRENGVAQGLGDVGTWKTSVFATLATCAQQPLEPLERV